MRAAAIALPFLVLLGCSPAVPAAKADPLPRSRVAIHPANGGRHPVEVELATNDADRARGLMHRRTLGAEEGMLFVFPDERILSFWMKNTLIPLDMLFIDHTGTVVGIVENATPLTLSPRGVKLPSRYVLEVNGGWCAKKGVRAGDRVDLHEAIEAALKLGVQ